MLTEVKRHLKLIGTYFKFNLAAAMEYRGSFLLQVFGMVLNNAAFIIFWAVLFGKINRIGGYGFRDVMFIWGSGLFCVRTGAYRFRQYQTVIPDDSEGRTRFVSVATQRCLY